MELLLPIVLLAGSLVVGVLRTPPSWLRAVAGVGSQLGPGVNAGPAAASVEWDVRRRMDVIADELERLRRDPAVFAKAFRTNVAKSALEALLAEASRLAAVPSLDLDRGPNFDFDLDLAASPIPRREVLER